MLCPECMGTLVTPDGVTATCTVHGGEYRILFARSDAPAVAPPPPPPPAPLPTAPLNVTAPLNAAPPPPPLPMDISDEIPLAVMAPAAPVTRAPVVMCRVHPEMPAIAYCQQCGAPSCTTCDFAFPGGVHMCTTCATTPRDPVSGKRKTMVICSYLMAGWTTFATALIVGGVFRGASREMREAMGRFPVHPGDYWCGAVARVDG